MDFDENIDKEAYQRFFSTLMLTLVDSRDDRSILYKFFEEHLEYLNDFLVEFLEVWAEIQLPRMSQRQLKAIGLIIEHFGNSIQEFPLGQRRWNLEIAITCYKILLDILRVSRE